MDKELSKQIIQANLTLHKAEAGIYDLLHRDIFSRSQQNRLHQVVARALKNLSGQNLPVLDLGAGTGNMTLILSRFARINSIDAVDLSPEMLAELEKKIQKSQDLCKIKIVTADVDSFLSRTRTTYALIAVSSVLHHLPEYEKTLDSMLLHLQPGGVLLSIMEPTGEESALLDTIHWLDQRIFNRFFLTKDTQKAVRQLNYTLADYHAQHGFSLHKLKERLGRSNNVRILFEVKYNLFKLSVFRLLGKILPRKNNFILAVQKQGK